MSETFRAPTGHPRRAAAGLGPLAGADRHLRRLADRFGYGLVHGPMFEDLGVFSASAPARRRAQGMYDFHDKGDRHIALRPEATASWCAPSCSTTADAMEVWCVSPVFRYERPRPGGCPHHQLDIEVLGSADPDVDVRGHRPGAAYLASSASSDGAW